MKPETSNLAARKQRKHLRKFYTFLGILFAALLLGLAVITVILPDQDYSQTEKRSLAKFPPLTLSSLADGSFMDGMEDWQADQFPLRDTLMQAKSRISILLGAIRSQDVYRANDGSLMEAFTMPSQERLDEQTGAIIDFAERYPDTNIYYCIAPTAISVLTDKLPKAVLTDDQNLYIEHFQKELADYGTFVDVRETFAEKKNDTELYYYTDHHWTTDAAYLAWQDLYEAMDLTSDVEYTSGIVCNSFSGSLLSASGFPQEQYDAIRIYMPEKEPVYTVTYTSEQRLTASVYAPEHLEGSDPYQVFFGGNYPQITIKTGSDGNRKLLVFKDSYANCLIPFLIPDFTEITIIDARYYYDDLDVEMLSAEYSDVLFLYNANTLSEDNSLVAVLKNEQYGASEEKDPEPEDILVPDDEQTEPFPEETPEETTEESAEESTEESTEESAEESTEAETPEETTTKAPETEPPLTVNDIAFIGDSRTLTMATGGRLAFQLVPDSSVFATWGGQLIEDSARNNALTAASANPEIAVFWYGINDVQLNPDRNNAAGFRANYEAIVNLYKQNNPDGRIVILSILPTSVDEKDYYEGQDANIAAYNSQLAAMCQANGYTYLDINSLYTGEECFAPEDDIHFSKEWYQSKFLPTVLGALGI